MEKYWPGSSSAKCASMGPIPLLPFLYLLIHLPDTGALKGKRRPYSITERMVPELIPVLGSQPVVDVSHKPGSRLPSFSARPAFTSATLKRAATSFAAW